MWLEWHHISSVLCITFIQLGWHHVVCVCTEEIMGIIPFLGICINHQQHITIQYQWVLGKAPQFQVKWNPNRKRATWERGLDSCQSRRLLFPYWSMPVSVYIMTNYPAWDFTLQPPPNHSLLQMDPIKLLANERCLMTPLGTIQSLNKLRKSTEALHSNLSSFVCVPTL